MSTAEQIISHLAAFNLKNLAGNRYRFNSPFRAGADGMTCSLVIHDDEHGAWKDHKADEGGSLYDLAARLGIETPQQAPPEKRNKTYKGLADYAAGHGVEVAAFEYFKWADTTRYKKRAIEIPTRTGTRYRMLEGDNKFLNPEGYKACLYGLNSRVMQRIAQGQPLVYANGEASVVVAQHLGLAAFTVAGGGEKPIPTVLLDELLHWLGDCKPGVIVALDSDAKGAAAALQVRGQLAGVGLDAVAVDLNLWNKGDLADFCSLHTEDPLAALLELPELTTAEDKTTEYQRWRIITEDEMWSLKPLSFLLEPFIPDSMVGVLFGQSNIGKSFVSLDWAMELSRAYPVTYLIAEGFEGYPARIAAWRQHHRVPKSDITFVKGGVRLLEDDDFSSFLAMLEQSRPRFLVIDTVKKTIVGRNASDEKDVSLYLDRCYEIKERLGCSVLLIHHTNKGGSKMHGSYSWTTDVDFVINAYEEDGMLALKSDKDRNNPKGNAHYRQIIPVYVERNGQEYNGAVIIAAEKIIQTANDPLTQKQLEVLEVIALPVYRASFTAADLASYFGDDMSYRHIMRCLSRLKDSGYIIQPKNRSPYRLSDKGYEHLQIPYDSHDTYDIADSNVTSEGTDVTSVTKVTSVTMSQTNSFEDYARDEFGADVIELPGFESDPPNQYDYGA